MVCVVFCSNGWAKLNTGSYCSMTCLTPLNCKFDAEKAVAKLISQAHSKSIGYCASYTKLALQAGGIPYATCNATDCEPYMLKNGFKVISNNKQLLSYKKGDVVIFFKTSKHIYGHMQMWSGSQ